MTTPIAFDPEEPIKTMYFVFGPSRQGPGFYGPKGMFKSTDVYKGERNASFVVAFTWPGRGRRRSGGTTARSYPRVRHQ